MEFYNKEIHMLAKKHRKLFENIFINPGGLLINNHRFYWVNYLRFGKLVGVAVVSPNNVKEIHEFKEAFYHLSRSSQIRSNLTRDGGFRANINMKSFVVMEKFLSTILEETELMNDRKIIVDCHITMQNILNLQNRLVEVYKSYQQKEIKFHEGTEEFESREYLEFVIDCAIEIDYIQFTQLTLQYEAITNFDLLKKMINKNKDLKSYMNTEIRVYLNEFINSRTDLLNNIKELTYTPEINQKLSKERHMEISREVLLQTVDNVTFELLNDLRFPDLK